MIDNQEGIITFFLQYRFIKLDREINRFKKIYEVTDGNRVFAGKGGLFLFTACQHQQQTDEEKIIS